MAEWASMARMEEEVGNADTEQGRQHGCKKGRADMRERAVNLVDLVNFNRFEAMESGGATAGVGAEKNSWPEVVGLSSEEAKKKIIEHKPDASVHVVPADSFVTMDYNTGRVRVFVDSNDKVTKAPRIG
ncbi:subtilisin-chymotrypsin inhibitor-2B [Triticum aestivum]|nr:subtilisin-chymotrypsin inhibitor-2B-like [Triticum aestivum]